MTAADHDASPRPDDTQHAQTSDTNLVAKFDRTVLIMSPHGLDSGQFGDNALMIDDTRWVSDFKITVNGGECDILSSSVSEDGARLEISSRSGTDVFLNRRLVVDDGKVHEKLVLKNEGKEPCVLSVEIAHGTDFAPIWIMRGDSRTAKGTFVEPVHRPEQTQIGYTGRDNTSRRAIFAFSEAAAANAPQGARFELTLAPGESRPLYFRYGKGTGTEPAPSEATFAEAKQRAESEASRFLTESGSVECDDPVADQWFRRSRQDLNLLMMNTEGGLYPAAGIPWYATEFGRDGMITAEQLLPFHPGVARGVLKFAADRQYKSSAPDIRTAGEFGKTPHEVRRDEMSNTGEKPFRQIYTATDNPLLFVRLASLYLRRTGDTDFIREIRPELENALTWMQQNRSKTPDGFVTYDYKSDGPKVSIFRDSDGSVMHRDTDWGDRDLPSSFLDARDLGDLSGVIDALNERLVETHGFQTQKVLPSHFHDRGVKTPDDWHALPDENKKDIILSAWRAKLMPKDPVAPVCLQGYAYSAMQAASDIFTALDDREKAQKWREEAEGFRQTFDEKFWLPEDGFYAHAIDGDGRPCRVLTSDTGELLKHGIVPEDKAALVVKKLMGSLFNGYGIPTMAPGQDVAGFGYLTYHNGSLWVHHSGIGAAGMAANGFTGEACRVHKAHAELSGFKDGRIAEVVSGAPRVEGVAPEKYPAGCEPQAWTAGAAFEPFDLKFDRNDPDNPVKIGPAWAAPPEWGTLRFRNMPMGDRRLNFDVEPGPNGPNLIMQPDEEVSHEPGRHAGYSLAP